MTNFDKFNLICIKDSKSGEWLVYPKGLPELPVQVAKIEHAPEKLAQAFEAFIRFGLAKNTEEKHTV